MFKPFAKRIKIQLNMKLYSTTLKYYKWSYSSLHKASQDIRLSAHCLIEQEAQSVYHKTYCHLDGKIFCIKWLPDIYGRETEVLETSA